MDVGWAILVNLAVRCRNAAKYRRRWRNDVWYCRRYANEFEVLKEILRDAKKIYARAVKENSDTARALMVYLGNRFRKTRNKASFGNKESNEKQEELFDRYIDEWNAYAASRRIYYRIEE